LTVIAKDVYGSVMAQNVGLSVDDLEIGTIFSSGVEFDGKISLSQPVLVHGSLKGTITSTSDIFISQEAKVDADMEARRISVKGQVSGTIHAQERLELFKTARISGAIKTSDIVVQSGAVINAQCQMSEATTGE
jgi:cytoskeletal protein CcmA (bactofilin family)